MTATAMKDHFELTDPGTERVETLYALAATRRRHWLCRFDVQKPGERLGWS